MSLFIVCEFNIIMHTNLVKKIHNYVGTLLTNKVINSLGETLKVEKNSNIISFKTSWC